MLASNNQVRDMTAFVIHCCFITHIKIIIQSLYCNPLPYCDHNTDSPSFSFLIISFITLPGEHINVAKAEINIYKCIFYVFTTQIRNLPKSFL